MNFSEKTEKSQQFKTDLINRCWEDEAFKQALITDPVATLEKLGASVNTDRKIVINDQTDASVLNINIPPKPNFEDLELNDEELELVAGGSGWFDFDFDFSSIGICIDVL